VVHAIKKDGTLWTWGFGQNGELGNSSTIVKPLPIQIGTDTNWSNISSGANHTSAVKTNGTIWMWGNNDSGQLGNANQYVSESSPIQIGTLTDWSTVSCGNSYTMAVKTNGTLWAWGLNTSGRMGTNSTTSYSSPVQIGTLTDWSRVFAGNLHTLAIKTDGTLWAWGAGLNGQLGNLAQLNRSSPVQVGSFTDWSDASAGGSFSIAVRSNGTIWSWGITSNGIAGRGTGALTVSSPVQIGTLTNWKTISTSRTGHSAVATKTDGTVWAWGLNSRGQLGVGDRLTKSSPVQVGTLTAWVSGSAGQFTSLFLQS
jgi:alpha-tubulin suppressor-like RCC1 family protein